MCSSGTGARAGRAGSVSTVTGVQGNSASYSPGLSADGRVVVFTSQSTNLVAGDTNAAYDVFLRGPLR